MLLRRVGTAVPTLHFSLFQLLRAIQRGQFVAFGQCRIVEDVADQVAHREDVRQSGLEMRIKFGAHNNPVINLQYSPYTLRLSDAVIFY